MAKKIDWISPMSLTDKIKLELYASLFAVGHVGSVVVAALFIINDYYFCSFFSFVALLCLLPFSNKKMDEINQKYQW